MRDEMLERRPVLDPAVHGDHGVRVAGQMPEQDVEAPPRETPRPEVVQVDAVLVQEIRLDRFTMLT